MTACAEAIHNREGITRRKIFEEGLKVALYAKAKAVPLIGSSGT